MDEILSAINVPIDHPLFYPRLFALMAKHVHAQGEEITHSLSYLFSEEYDELSRRLERAQIQESCSVRNVARSRNLAVALIDAKGEFNTHLLPPLIVACKKHAYSLGPQRQYDGPRHEHILRVLQLLQAQPEFIRLLKKFTRPLSNKRIEDLIRYTLQLTPATVVTDGHTRQAVLAAWFCYLRQNVGSCFATAPAEMIHDEQPERFLQDLLDLIATGMLKRTFGGIENAIPLSDSWGSGDLKKPLVIRLSRKGVTPEIWQSPGLIAAFEAVGVFKDGESLGAKIKQMAAWIKPLVASNEAHTVILTAEEVIRAVLLKEVGISEKQLEEYVNRPKESLRPTSLTPPLHMSIQMGGIAARCLHFFHLFETAKNTFKSLSDNALLKSWEFTLASFSDIKYEFARWNFYASLGLGTNEPGGIGACIHETIQHKLDLANHKVEEIQREYEMTYTQVKTLESRMRHASAEKEVEWVRMEYQSRVNEFYFLEEQRNAAQAQAAVLVKLYDTLYRLYVDLFKHYFQEVYDADLQDVTVNRFDDSPAGFRLLYKHGRSNTSQWTRINDQYDFVEALTAFFIATEPEIAHAVEEKNIEKDLADVVTAIVHHIKTKEFLESAFHRMAAAHRVPCIANPLDHLDQIEKKPWVYTSGGTMNTLVSCYYRLEEKPREAEKWVESEMELLVYLADTLKQLAPSSSRAYLQGERRAMLMQSPSHAFLLKPGLSPFSEMWNNEEFTYTFIRDRFVRPAERFVDDLLLDDEGLQWLMEELSEKIPENYLPRFHRLFHDMRGLSNSLLFREYLADALSHDRGLQRHSQPVLAIDEIDSTLYSALPLCPVGELEERVEKVIRHLPGLASGTLPQILRSLEKTTKSNRRYLGARQVQDICKAFLSLTGKTTTATHDYPLLISQAAQKLGFAMPSPMLFADTNWVKDMFGFVVSPGTGRLELWRLDYTGSQGYPMSSWAEWLNGSTPNQKWGIYIRPFEYGQS